MTSGQVSEFTHRPIETSAPGIYALVLESVATSKIRYGKRGELDLVAGVYLYVGSAFGLGGLGARIGHHGRPALRPHWHIDYLRAHVALKEVWYACDGRWREHQWAAVLAHMPVCRAAAPNFGSTDCTCPSHLFFTPTLPSLAQFDRRLRALYPDHARICRGSPPNWQV